DVETPTQRTLSVAFQGLPTLGSGYVYEGWLITSVGPVSTGRFTDAKGATTEVDPTVADDSSAYVLTIEPEVGDDPAPSNTHVVAGTFSSMTASLDMKADSALGTDFTEASGGFILETPTTEDATDYNQGIWYLDPGQGPGASLTLPTLPAGWAYEGWVVVDGVPQSTGRFTEAAAVDADGAGTTAGPMPAPPFPGQDFITPAVDLVGAKAVISVEPDPDDSAEPFALKPLLGDITDAGAGILQTLSNAAADTAITGTATLE
ncbi:MAG: anti-sigma factor, partial [Deltaproteobacteria bacterium]|nr:anti-sigma factor [Deltaproteobacteria bacterium]